jgi:hypothetical protein
MTRVLQLCTLAGIVTGLLALTVPASAQTGWTVVPPPAGTVGDELTGSYALSNTDAWAVGYLGNTSTGPETPVALNWNGTDDIWGISRDDMVTHYNGTSWTTYTLSAPSGTPIFEGVAALSPADVWVVGTGPNSDNPLILSNDS